MRQVQQQLLGSIAIAGVLVAAMMASSANARTIWKRSYSCGNAAITVTEQDAGRYIYNAANARGNSLTIKNGTHHRDDKRNSVYTFYRNGVYYVVRDLGRGKATFATSGNTTNKLTNSCTY